jgi:hypothetical protein
VAHLRAAKPRLAATPTALRGGGQVRDADERPPGPLWQVLALGVQPKLAVSAPDHPAEREADRVAEEVMRTEMPRPPGPATPAATGAVALRASPHPKQASGQGRDAVDQVVAGPLGSGAPMEPGLRGFFEPRFGRSLRDVRLHTDTRADAAARSLDALAFTQGSDVVFRAGNDPAQSPSGRRLLAHELTHVVQGSRWGAPAGGAGAPTVLRVPATPRAVTRKTRTQIFGLVLGIGGLTLAEFQDYTKQVQADWFAEPTLAAADRDFLWDMLLMLAEGPFIRSGIGDMSLAALHGVAPADWPALKAFCRATHTGQPTVRIFPPLPSLADRIALGRTLLDLEAIILPAQLEVTVSQSQLQRLRATPGLMVQLRTYWTSFQPFLEETFSPAPGAIGPEFEQVLAFLTAIGPGGLAALMPLQGGSPATRWVRNLHRFPLPMLNRLVTNLGETSGKRELVLILHTGHDQPGAFRRAASLFSDLVMNTGSSSFFGLVFGPDNLVLMIEGAPSLTEMTGRIPTITSTWGKMDSSGTRRINQVVIAGHGSGHTVGMAGLGAPVVAGGHVRYPEESLDTGANRANTQALLDALLTHMDPATARVLFAGCLVGSRTVAAGTPAAAIPATLAADQSLAAFTEARATAAGLPVTPGVTVQAARGSVGLAAVTSLKDPSGRLHPTYPMDPNVFGAAPTYAQSGLEPEGVLRAAVEVAASPLPGGRVPAETMLRTRLGMPARPTDWYDTITRLMVGQVLPAVPGSGVDLRLLNEAANVAEVPFLVRWTDFGITAAHFVTRLNPQPFAAGVYTGLSGTTAYSAPTDAHTRRLRIVVDQGRFALTGSAATLLSGILATGLNANAFKDYLDTTPTVLGGHEAALMPLVGGPSTAQIRLALAWFLRDPAHAPVQTFLSGQVTTVAGVPAFSPAVATEITAAGQGTSDVLEALGFRLTPTGPPAVGGGAPLPLANVQLPGQALNTVFVDPRPRVATVIPTALNVRTGPSMAHPPFAVVHAGDQVKVAGKAGNWSAIDVGGRLGFVFTLMITP